jgi:hypothetical protein
VVHRFGGYELLGLPFEPVTPADPESGEAVVEVIVQELFNYVDFGPTIVHRCLERPLQFAERDRRSGVWDGRGERFVAAW